MFRISAPRSAALALAALVAMTGASVQAQGPTDEVTVTIDHVKALDLSDWGLAGKSDFYARVTIAGETFRSKHIRGSNDVYPGWTFTKRVPKGRTDVMIEILDKDVGKADDVIDINRVDNKRSLEFVVNTASRPCRLEGFADAYRCGDKVMRSGTERKRAELTFHVNVGR